jgi:hypothetical protein
MSEVRIAMETDDIKKANREIVDFQNSSMGDSRKELHRLQRKLSVTYWVIIALSVIMFAIGIGLLSVPFLGGLAQKADMSKSIVSGSVGIADLAGLFFFKPLERIHKLMGDMSQIFMATNSYQAQVGLHLLQMDLEDRQTIGDASDKIAKAAEESIKLIEDYFEKGGMLK